MIVKNNYFEMMRNKTKNIVIYRYDTNWPKIYEIEAEKIRDALGNNFLEIHHIGSTSVPGLSAKRDIDILCVISSLNKALALEKIDYIYKGEFNVPLRFAFSKNTFDSKVNLHVVEKDHGFIALNLAFRDYLRGHVDARIEYEELKRKLIEDPDSHIKTNSIFTGYNLGKNDFIKSILEKAGFDDFAINFCAHYKEWDEYHRIRAEQVFEPRGIIYDRNHPCVTAENNYHMVLYKGTKIVSTAHVELLSKSLAVLRTLGTDEIHKRQGYGTYLMKWVEKWIRSKGRNIVKLHSRYSAVEFYSNIGYVEMDFSEDEPLNQDLVDMGKVL